MSSWGSHLRATRLSVRHREEMVNAKRRIGRCWQIVRNSQIWNAHGYRRPWKRLSNTAFRNVDGSGNKREWRRGKEYRTRVDGEIYLRVYVEEYQKSVAMYFTNIFPKRFKADFTLRVKIYCANYIDIPFLRARWQIYSIFKKIAWKIEMLVLKT